MKKQSPAITKLKKENETLIQQLHEKDASAQYWKRRYEELEGRRVQREGEGFKLDGINSNRGSVMEASAHRALSELHSVAPNEVNVASLHRVIGSAQGALALALENTGRVQVDTIDLSPKKDQASDKLDKIASVLHRNERYG